MKYILTTFLFVFYGFLSFGQTEWAKFKTTQLGDKELFKTELKSKLIHYDFSGLFNHTDNSMVYGFIGANYQRIRIKLISITKDTLSPDTYIVYGKSMVKNNIDEFHGIIKISNIRKSNITQHGCEDEYKYKGYKGQFVILGDYRFAEDSTQSHSGVFKGTFRANFFLDNLFKVKYDDIENCADGYNNNQFVGQWASYKGTLVERCNWGDFRIPNSGDFDTGAGEISPNGKYLNFGWQSLRDLYGPPLNRPKAKRAEEGKWW